MTDIPHKKMIKQLNKTINSLASSMTKTDDLELQADIAEQMSTLMVQRTKLTHRILKNETNPFKTAMKSLADLTREAKAAKEDVNKVEKMVCVR